MNKLAIRTVLALSLFLLAAAISGVGVGSAAAGNTTGVLCAAVTTGATFSDSDCTTAQAGGEGFVHKSFPENTSTPVTVGSTTSTTFKTTVFSTTLTMICTSAGATNVILNTQGPGGGHEMYSWGTGVITFSGCTVTSPAGSNCKVNLGTIKTKPLLFTTLEQGMGVKFGPESGSLIAEVKIEGCTGSAVNLNRTYELTGSVVLTPNGAVLSSTHAGTTAQGTLFLGTSTIGMTTSLTMMTSNGSGAISWTT
jgi:hypothetical protein